MKNQNFFKITDREIENIFFEIENKMTSIFFNSYANFFFPIDNGIEDEEYIKYFKNDSQIRNSFDQFIIDIKQHLLKQFENYEKNFQFASFVDNQKIYYLKNKSKKNKTRLYKKYLVEIIYEYDSSILQQIEKVSNQEKEYVEYWLEIYLNLCEKLKIIFDDFISNYKTNLRNHISNTEKIKKQTKTFPEYLLHPKRDILATKLKEEFKTERGKGIRLMLEALVDNEPQLLILENRQRKATLNALEKFFDRNIGKYQGVFDHKEIDKTNLKNIKVKLDFILRSIEKDK